MKALTATLVVLVLLANACSRQSPLGAIGCAKDLDCKGDRVCQNGQCIAPPPPQPATPATCNEANWGKQGGCAAGEKCLCGHIGGPITPVECSCGTPAPPGTCGNRGETCSANERCCKVPIAAAGYHCTTPSDELICEGGIN